jgi:hypothetical protein
MRGVGPTYVRTRLVALAKRRDGVLFLICTCHRYQRELLFCEHVWKVKEGKYKVAEDVHFHYHARYNILSAPLPSLTRQFDEGQRDGPGTYGIDDTELARASSCVPELRSSVAAFLAERWTVLAVPVAQMVFQDKWVTQHQYESRTVARDLVVAGADVWTNDLLGDGKAHSSFVLAL